MKIVMRDGRVFQGTALQIVKAMQDIAFGVEDFTVPKYIEWVVANARKFEEVELDAPGPHEIRVRTVASGVCGSDLHVLLGDNPWSMPIVLGHEPAGIAPHPSPREGPCVRCAGRRASRAFATRPRSAGSAARAAAWAPSSRT